MKSIVILNIYLVGELKPPPIKATTPLTAPQKKDNF